MKKLTRNDVTSNKKISITEVEVPEWDGIVCIKELTIEERLAFDAKYTDSEGKFKNVNDPEMIYELLRKCLVDEDGNKLFEDSDVEIMKQKSGPVMQRLFLKVININYLSQLSIDETKKKSVAPL